MQPSPYDNSNLLVPPPAWDVDIATGEIHVRQDDSAVRDALAMQTPPEFELTARGLIIHGRPSFGEWLNFGLYLRDLKRSIQWALGDWINYGETAYSEKYAQALDATDYDYGTLRNYAWVASRFEMSRRDDKLTFSHYTVVAPLKPAEQDALLIEAKTQQLTRDELREKVNKALGKPAPPKKLFDDTLTVGGIATVLLNALPGDKLVRVAVWEVTP